MSKRSIKDRATELGFKAMGKLMEDPKRAEQVGKAFQRVQESVQAFDKAKTRALHAAGLATKEDFKDAGKRLKDLAQRIDSIGRAVGKIEARLSKAEAGPRETTPSA